LKANHEHLTTQHKSAVQNLCSIVYLPADDFSFDFSYSLEVSSPNAVAYTVKPSLGEADACDGNGNADDAAALEL
jgi:hypothetical protein